MASWLFCFLCFTSYVSLTAFYTENEPIKLVIRNKLTFILHSFADPPSLITRALDQVVLEGGPAINLTCTADGEPAPNITWTRVFANGSDSDVLFSGDQFILPSNRSIDGTYRCKVSNGIRSDVNHTVTVVEHCEYCLLYVSDFQSIHLSTSYSMWILGHLLQVMTYIFCISIIWPLVVVEIYKISILNCDIVHFYLLTLLLHYLLVKKILKHFHTEFNYAVVNFVHHVQLYILWMSIIRVKQFVF